MRIGRLTAKKRIPIYVLFELTRGCNLRCKHCYATKEERPELSTEDVKGVILQLKKENCLIVSFSGGEVLLRGDFPEIGRFARRNGFALKIFTNGTLIDNTMADHIAGLKPLRVEVSVFSVDARIHDSITGVEGSLKRTLGALEALRNRGVSLGIKTPLMKDNFSGYRDIIKLAKNLGVKYRFDPTIIPGLDGGVSALPLRISMKEVSELLNDNEIAASEEGSSRGRRTSVEILCSAGHNSCAISAYGDLLPCIILPVKLGSLKERSFSEIWRNHWRAGLPLGLKDVPECFGCAFHAYCAPCPGLAYLEEGNAFKPARRNCDIAKIRFKLSLAKMKVLKNCTLTRMHTD